MDLFQHSPNMSRDFACQITGKGPDKKSNMEALTMTKSASEDKNAEDQPSSSSMPPASRKQKDWIFCRFNFGNICYRVDAHCNLRPAPDFRPIRLITVYK